MAIGFVTQTTAAGNYVPSLSIIPENSTTGSGNTLVLVVGINFEGASPKENARISSVIDDAHNEWIQGTTAAVDGPSGSPYEGTRVSIWYCVGASPASMITVTATQTVDGFCANLSEYSGVTNVAPLAATPTGNAASSGTAVQASITTTSPNSLVIAAAVNGNSGLTFPVTTSGSFTALHDCDTFQQKTNVDGVLLRSAYRIVTSSTTYSRTWTLSSSSSAAWCSLALKAGDVSTTNPNPNWPQIKHELAFGANPNDPADVPTWTDVTNRVTEFSTRRGRDYELARTEAGEANVRMRNDDGFLNPGTNEDVRVFTPYRCRAVWNGLSFPVFTGYVERWPQVWDNQYGTSPLVAVDGLATLSGTRLTGTLGSEILADNPEAYWPLDDGRLAREAANKSTKTTTSLVAVDATNGGGNGFFGSELDLQGEESTCWEQSIYSLTDPPNSTTGICLRGSLNLPSLATSGVLVECWARIPDSGTTDFNHTILALKGSTFSNESLRRIMELRINPANGQVTLAVSNSSGTLGNVGIESATRNDDAWHHYVVHLTSNRAKLWIDGALIFDQALASVPAAPIDLIYVGGMQDEWSSRHFAIGRFAHVAVFKLNSADSRRIAIRANAGVTGFPERSGARISRLLNYAGWNAGRAIDVGLSLLGAANTIAKQTLLQAVQDVASWENGLAFVDSGGKFRFFDRADRFGQVEKWVFGDGPGELPYETDVEVEYDPKYVYNDVTITKSAGKSSGGGSAHKRDQDSVRSYFMRTLDKTSGVASVTQCEAEAQWVLENYAQPRMRLAHITICPSANPDLWPVALGVEIGDRVTVRRRPFGGEQITLECYVEQVNHDVRPGEWKTTYSLSPVLLTTYSGESDWILGSSKLDVDTYLG